MNDNPMFFIDPDGMEVTDWYKDKEGKYRYDEKVKNQDDVDKKLEKGNGTYMAASFKEEKIGAEFRKDGSIFFKKEHILDGIALMYNYSYTDNWQKITTEYGAGITENGDLIVTDANKNDGGTVNFDKSCILDEKTRHINFLESDGKKYKIIATIHTHPNLQSQSDTPSPEDYDFIKKRLPYGIDMVVTAQNVFIHGQYRILKVMTHKDFDKEIRQGTQAFIKKYKAHVNDPKNYKEAKIIIKSKSK
jgi:hypothetical protein